MRNRCTFLTGILFFISSTLLWGQSVTDTLGNRVSAPRHTTIQREQKDIVDVIYDLLNRDDSSRSGTIKPGDKPVLSVLPAIGYTLQTRFAVIVAGNIAFYTSKKQDAKLSVITTAPTYTQNKQFTVPLFINVWLKGDAYYLLGDWRFMKYPQSTFGLGSDTHLSEENPMNYDYVRFYQYILKRIARNFSLGFGYTFDHHWNISEAGTVNGLPSDYAKYGKAGVTTSSGPALICVYDSRANPINSNRGFMGSVVYRNNVEWLGSNTNWQSLIIDLRKYFPFPAHSNNVLAFWNYNWLVLQGDPPYLDLPATGWDNFNNTGRGFIQGRFRGNMMVYLESEYRFQITANGLIGGTAFVNVESFSAPPAKKLQGFQPAAGLGLRIKLNKKSNTNICIDYGFGTEGMRGFFVNVGEVF